MKFQNICEKCGAENTLWPYWKGKKRMYKCEKCGQFAKGITKAKWEKMKKLTKKELKEWAMLHYLHNVIGTLSVKTLNREKVLWDNMSQEQQWIVEDYEEFLTQIQLDEGNEYVMFSIKGIMKAFKKRRRR